MEGKAFIEIAQKLAPMRTEPASRSAIGRAYYAVYNCWIQLLSELGFKFGKDASAHDKIYAYINNSGIQELKETADALRHLRRRRNLADYDMETQEFLNHILCQLDVARAQAVILQIEKYSKEPLRTQLKNGLRAYHAIISPSSSSN